MARVDTDYLVVGAGAAGLAFADALIAASDADVVMVDRRHGPGGHWNDAYPFVRQHQPSAFYGVNSRVLGGNSIDRAGPNAGFYERATAAEICGYYQRVLEEHLLASGRVRFFGMSDWLGEGAGRGPGAVPADRCGGHGAGAAPHRRCQVSGDLDPGDSHPVLWRRAGSAADSGQRPGQAGRAGERVHGHGRRQDGHGRVHLAAGERGAAGGDPLDQAAGRLAP